MPAFASTWLPEPSAEAVSFGTLQSLREFLDGVPRSHEVVIPSCLAVIWHGVSHRHDVDSAALHWSTLAREALRVYANRHGEFRILVRDSPKVFGDESATLDGALTSFVEKALALAWMSGNARVQEIEQGLFQAAGSVPQRLNTGQVMALADRLAEQTSGSAQQTDSAQSSGGGETVAHWCARQLTESSRWADELSERAGALIEENRRLERELAVADATAYDLERLNARLAGFCLDLQAANRHSIEVEQRLLKSLLSGSGPAGGGVEVEVASDLDSAFISVEPDYLSASGPGRALQATEARRAKGQPLRRAGQAVDPQN